MKILFLLPLAAACSMAPTDALVPVWAGTMEACRSLQVKAVEEAESRAEAEERVAAIRRDCDIAYEGLTHAGHIIDRVVQEDE